METEQIKALVLSGMSLNSITKIIPRSKSTIYYRYKKLEGARKMRKLTLPVRQSTEVGEFIGVFAGDGNYYKDSAYRYQIRIFITATDKRYVAEIASLINSLFGVFPWVYERKPYNVTIIRLISKPAVAFIKTYLDFNRNKSASVKLKGQISDYDTNFIIGFLRGLLDTDGHIELKRKRLAFATISLGLANDVEDCLKRLNVSYYSNVHIDRRGNRHPMYRIYIHRDFDKFVELVEPKHFNYLRQ